MSKTRGGKRENAGRPTGKTHKKILISLPLETAEWLETKENKSGYIAGLIGRDMNDECAAKMLEINKKISAWKFYECE
jgi:hypothetical protein